MGLSGGICLLFHTLCVNYVCCGFPYHWFLIGDGSIGLSLASSSDDDDKMDSKGMSG